jgi:hypothetical protein
MSTRTWPVNIPRQPVKPRRVDPPVESTWLFRVNPARALQIEGQKGRKK